MEGSFKRKLDSIVDSMDVIVPEANFEEYDKFYTNKKMKLDTNNISQGWPIEWKDNKGSDLGIPDHNSDYHCDGMDYDNKPIRKSMYLSEELIDSDVPSTHEVIDSLRKVKLWLSAQEENNDYHIQHISSVQDYAISKQHNYHQQRKITEFLVRPH